jgi:hypothetical protein
MKIKYIGYEKHYQSEVFKWKVNNKIYELWFGYDEENGEWYISMIINGTIDYEAYYTTPEGYKEIIEELKSVYPFLAEEISLIE